MPVFFCTLKSVLDEVWRKIKWCGRCDDLRFFLYLFYFSYNQIFVTRLNHSGFHQVFVY